MQRYEDRCIHRYADADRERHEDKYTERYSDTSVLIPRLHRGTYIEV
jgi:hypothetical protein